MEFRFENLTRSFPKDELLFGISEEKNINENDYQKFYTEEESMIISIQALRKSLSNSIT